MNQDQPVILQKRGQLTLLTGLALVAVPFLFQLPVWVGLLLLGQLALRAMLVAREQPPLPKWILLLFVLASMGVIFLQFHTLFGLGAGSALLLLMLGFKVLETRNHRDVMISLFLGYFAVTTAFLFNQNIILLPYLLLTAFVLTLALHQLNDVLGTQRLAKHLASAGLMFTLAVPVMVVLFVIFPRLSSPLWALPQADRGKTGISDTMSPGDISLLLQSNSPAFRVTFGKQQPPARKQRYWRGPVLDQFDGKRWFSSKPRRGSARPVVTAAGERTEYRITLEPHNRLWVFPLDIPVKVPAETTLDHHYVMRSRAPVKDLKQFSLTSSTTYRLVDEVDAWALHTATQLPDGIAPKARELAAKLKSGSPDDETYINRVLDYFNQQDFHYTLRPRQLQGDHIDDFLFSSRAGFCEHYASSFVVLMRLAGVPARVVTGYMGGQWNNNARYLLVRQSDAHAWAEVWIDGKGWIRVDPTGAIAPERIEASLVDALTDSNNLPMLQRISVLNQISLKWDMVNYYWGQWILAYDSGRQSQFLNKLGLSLNSVGKSLYTLFAGLLVILACWFVIFAVRYFRQPRDPVAASYDLFLRKLQGIGFTRKPHETARQFATRINARRPDLATEVVNITRSYQLNRYQRKMNTAATRQLQTLIRNFKPKKSPR